MLWAVTSYFNPLRYRRRLENYREFRRRLSVPLLTVELGYDCRFELAEGDAEILVQLAGRDVLWQKERLLNIALGALPQACDAVACVDCDVLFGREDWPEDARRLLERYPMAQAFSTVHHLSQDRSSRPDARGSIEFSQPGIASLEDPAGRIDEGIWDRRGGAPSRGFAWLYRRELIAKLGLFDGCIIGGGDAALACAAYGRQDVVVRMHHMNPWQERYYRSWAQPFWESMRGRVGALDGDLFHLWHGRIEDRRPRQRHAGLRGFDFDPFRDIALDESRCWRWNSDKPGLHAYLREYFSARREDG